MSYFRKSRYKAMRSFVWKSGFAPFAVQSRAPRREGLRPGASPLVSSPSAGPSAARGQCRVRAGLCFSQTRTATDVYVVVNQCLCLYFSLPGFLNFELWTFSNVDSKGYLLNSCFMTKRSKTVNFASESNLAVPCKSYYMIFSFLSSSR